MRRKRLLWQIYPSYLLITAISLVAITWYISRSVHQFYIDTTFADLEARARLVKAQIDVPLRTGDFEQINAICKALGRQSRTSISVVLVDGKVIGDTRGDPAQMENHADRPEIKAALRGGMGSARRFSTTFDDDMMYVAVAVLEGSRPVAVVRTALPTSAITTAVGRMYRKIAFAGVIVALLAALVGLVISRRITRPLELLTIGARRFAGGDLGTSLPVSNAEEIGALADAMNTMATQLGDRIQTVEAQKSQEAAILRSMSEAVFAVDSEERLIRMNSAAGTLFGIDRSQAIGKPLREVVRNHELLQLVGRALDSEEPLEGEITLDRPSERYLQVHGTVLEGATGGRVGALLVLNDVTRLRRLERVRRDFVANVSHELRTPITTIKGFVETLQEGAILNPDDADRFLAIIGNHTERLNAIIEDLLALSWLEQDTGDKILRERTRVNRVVARAVETCIGSAKKRRVGVFVKDPEPIDAVVNGPLIERAMVNLIDNAIKYSDEGGRVEVTLEQNGANWEVRVADFGCGIEKRHLPRIFERFYRTDHARSRALGGTGLGLAIVKHVALLHGGNVSVESKPGEGSTFSIHLPKKP